MLIQTKKVNKCKYSADILKKQASKEKKLFYLNQTVIKFIKTGIDIAMIWKEHVYVNIYFIKDRSAKIMKTILDSVSSSLWQKYYTF